MQGPTELQLSFGEHPFTGDSSKQHVVLNLTSYVSTAVNDFYLQLHIFIWINRKKQKDLFHSRGNLHLATELMEAVKPSQGYKAV